MTTTPPDDGSINDDYWFPVIGLGEVDLEEMRTMSAKLASVPSAMRFRIVVDARLGLADQVARINVRAMDDQAGWPRCFRAWEDVLLLCNDRATAEAIGAILRDAGADVRLGADPR